MILFEDNHLVVCVKPQGIISQSDENGKQNMVSLLQSKTNSLIYPIHRLDKETGGVMVFAKHKQSAALLSKLVADNKLNKEYLALAYGDIKPDSAELCDLLFRDKQKNKSYVVKRERKGVKKAVLTYQKLDGVVCDENLVSLIKINLKTGRTHQIRVQFSSRGFPLLGDKRYGSRDNFKNLALWSYKLSFEHPITHEKLTFKSLPENSDVFSLCNEALHNF